MNRQPGFSHVEPPCRLVTGCAYLLRVQIGKDSEAARIGTCADREARVVACQQRDGGMLQRVILPDAPAEQEICHLHRIYLALSPLAELTRVIYRTSPVGRSPKRIRPRRTSVAPSSTATSKSS